MAAIGVTPTAVRELGGLLGFGPTLDGSMSRAPRSDATHFGALPTGAAFTGAEGDVVSPAAGVRVPNALLLPTVIGVLSLLARRRPEPVRPAGARHPVAATVLAVPVALGHHAAVAGIRSRTGASRPELRPLWRSRAVRAGSPVIQRSGSIPRRASPPPRSPP